MHEISAAFTPNDYAAARELFQEYVGTLSVGLCIEGFAAELAELPTVYGPPGGILLLARSPVGALLGCVAIRPYTAERASVATAELKRLYVREAARGIGLGRALVEGAIGAARRRGYTRLVLDTLPEMRRAQALYCALGFVDIPPATAEEPLRLYYALTL